MNPALTQALATARAAGFDEPTFFRHADFAAESRGFVYFGPDAVVIAFDEGDCWLVWCAVGSLHRLIALAPHPRPRIEWARGVRDPTQTRRSLSWDRMQSLITHGRRKKETAAGGRPGHAVSGATAHGDGG